MEEYETVLADIKKTLGAQNTSTSLEKIISKQPSTRL
jgi:hypothetical protein